MPLFGFDNCEAEYGEGRHKLNSEILSQQVEDRHGRWLLDGIIKNGTNGEDVFYSAICTQ